MPKKAKKTEEKKVGVDLKKSLIIAGLLLLLLVIFKTTKRSILETPKPKEEVSQLTSSDTYIGNAVAARSWENGKYRVSLTAFLPKTQATVTYRARLVSQTMEPKLVDLGELTAAGDVYTLQYESSMNYSSYTEIEVLSVDSKTKTETTLLKGNF